MKILNHTVAFYSGRAVVALIQVSDHWESVQNFLQKLFLESRA